MALFDNDIDRQVIPRWRPFDITLKLGELPSPQKPSIHEEARSDLLESKVSEWEKHKTDAHAADLVGAALVLDEPKEAIGAAKHLLRRDSNAASQWARELAAIVLTRSSDASYSSEVGSIFTTTGIDTQVRTLRELLRTEPRDAIAWVDLSRIYASLGLVEQATRAMTVAQQLATQNRFVLRSASRFWIHLGELDRAHHIILQSERVKNDPWLLAAELAISGTRKVSPRHYKTALRMLADGRVGGIHTSELSAALATLELHAGNAKRSKKLFQKALDGPTDNSIAQIVWASRQGEGIELDEKYLAGPNTFEARAWTHFQQHSWDKVIVECTNWQLDLPFSSRPAIQGSYVAAVVLEDYSESKRFAEGGLVANPKDVTLLNNLAFACIKIGELKKAKKTIARIEQLQKTERELVVVNATKGLFELRMGDFEAGRRNYLSAIEQARKIKDKRLEAMAALFLAIESLELSGEPSEDIVTMATKSARGITDPTIEHLSQKLVAKVDGSATFADGTERARKH